MGAEKSLFVCDVCGYETYKWLGKCPACGGWDTIKEQRPQKRTVGARGERPVTVSDDEMPEERTVLGMNEMDRVLGGGLTNGSSILLGGDPGIGKTTICFEIASRLCEFGSDVLYVSGEESVKQLASRKKRLGLKGSFAILATSSIEDIINAINEHQYKLVIIDSIQSVYNPGLQAVPGSIGQIRDVSSRLIHEMKRREITHIFIGHVTKEGVIAGPKILEHMVDTVLYFEGDKMLPYRMLRAVKNRYGPVDEIGIFQMKKEGLVSVENPSLFFVSERNDIGSGSALYTNITGSRPIILEVQAITQKTNFSMPRRLSLGYDTNRLFILIAVLEKRLGMPFFDRDVYVNITGGLKVNEPAIDLAVAAAIVSSYRNISIGKNTASFGEIGLTGEIRRVVHMDLRLRECQRLGIQTVYCPKGADPVEGIEVHGLKNVSDLHRYLCK